MTSIFNKTIGNIFNNQQYKYLIDFILKKNTTKSILISVLVVGASGYLIRNWLKVLRFRKQYEKFGVKGPYPYPLVGNMIQLFSKGFINYQFDCKKKYGKKFINFELSNVCPVICTSDVELAKAVMVKDFRHFVNRRENIINEKPFNSFLTILKDEAWKNARSIVTTTFTTGKIKDMTPYILECCENVTEKIEEVIEKDGILNTREVFPKFTADVILSTSFGISVNTMKESNHPITTNIEALFKPRPLLLIIFIIPGLFTLLNKLSLVSLIPKEPTSYLTEFTNRIIEERRSKKIVRNDFIQNMISHEEDDSTEKSKEKANINDNINDNIQWKGSLKKTLNNDEILAMSIVFMIAGTDTTGMSLENVTYCLAMYPDIQDKLIAEVDNVLEKYDGKVSYDSISKMEYMNLCIDEAMRMYPAPLFLERTCSEDYEYDGIKFFRDQLVQIHIMALHYDESIYPEPEVYKPERERPVDAFLPFGNGPRNCIAKRFALVEMKLLLATILSKYRFEKCEKTMESFAFNQYGINVKSKEPIIVKILRR